MQGKTLYIKSLKKNVLFRKQPDVFSLVIRLHFVISTHARGQWKLILWVSEGHKRLSKAIK